MSHSEKQEEFVRKEKALLLGEQHSQLQSHLKKKNNEDSLIGQRTISSEKKYQELNSNRGRDQRSKTDENNLSFHIGHHQKLSQITQFPNISNNQPNFSADPTITNQSNPSNLQSFTSSLEQLNLNCSIIDSGKKSSQKSRKLPSTNFRLKQLLLDSQNVSTSTDFFSSSLRRIPFSEQMKSHSSKNISFVQNPHSSKVGQFTLNSFYDGKKQLKLPSKYQAAATQHFDISGETRELMRINKDYIRIMPTIKDTDKLSGINHTNNNNNLSFSNNNNNISKDMGFSSTKTQPISLNQVNSSQNLISLLDASSPLISETKADIMSQLQKKTKDNFYGKLIKQALQSESASQAQSKEICGIKQPSSSQHLKIPYDMRISSIKSKLTIQMLELLRSDLYGDNHNNTEEGFSQSLTKSDEDPSVLVNQNDSPTDWKFKKVVFPNESQYAQKLDAVQKSICEKRETSEQLSNKLFSLLQTKEPIISIHAAQNKDLNNFSERRDVVALAKWFQDMLGVVQKDNKKETSDNTQNQSYSNYSKTIADLQAVHQACIAEIIRQVSQHCAERGQLLKHVWESLMLLISEIFNQQQTEISLFQKTALKEVSSVQTECTEKIEYYLPLIKQLQSDIHKKEALNERIVLEFKYLKNKNSKLEKLLSEAKTEHKNFKEDYNHLAKQLDEHKLLNAKAITKHAEDKQRLTTKFVEQLDQITQIAQQRQEKFSEKLRMEMEELRVLNHNFDSKERQIDQEFKLNQAEVDKIEEKAYKTAFYMYPSKHEGIVEEEERDYYGENQRKSTTNRSDKSDENNMEIEGTDGIKLVLTSVAAQVEDDLILRQSAATDTCELYETINMAVQAVQPSENKSVQTPKEWMTRFQEISSSDSDHNNSESEDEINTSLVINMKEKEKKKKAKLTNVADQLVDTPLHKYIQALGQNQISDIHHDSTDIIMVPRLKRDSVQEKHKQISQIVSENSGSNQNITVKNSSHKIERRPSVVVKAANQTLESTLGNEIEKEVGDLKLLQNSKMKFVQEVLEKILKFDLLKDNPHLNSRTLLQFLEDSLAFQQEENQRLKNIRAQCKNNLIQNVRQKLDISEKLAEIEETKKNLDLGNGMYCKLKADYFKVVSQLNGNGPQDGQQTTSAAGKKVKDTDNNKPKIARASTTMHNVQPCITDNSDEDSSGDEGIRDGNISLSNTSISGQFIDNSNNESPDSKKFQMSSSQRSISNFKPVAAQTGQQPQATKSQTQKQQDFQRSNRRIATMVEQGNRKSSRQLQSPSIIAILQSSIYGDPQQLSRPSRGENFVSQQIIYQKKQIIDILQNERYKKLNLKKDFKNLSSSNAEAACNFFHTAGMKILSHRLKKNKGVLFTEGNTRRYIIMVYSEKMKQLRQGDRTNPLYAVAYDFFLNKFGFKKMAEKNLKQFLRSLQYHYQQEKCKTFLRFYGIDHAITYDDDDFNFYIECLIQLEDNPNSLPIYDQMNLFPINKLLDVLFKAFDNGKVSARVLNRIRSEIESMRFVSADPALRTKNLIDQDLGMECLLSAKFEEKKNDFLAMRPVYLAGDVDRNEVIGLEEFSMLGRNIQKNINQIVLTQLYSQNTDLIDDITGEKTMSFQQFTVIAVKSGLFTTERTMNYVDSVDKWDEIKNLQILRQHWASKKDVIRLRLVKAGAYRNFYRLMVKQVDEYFQQLDKQEEKQMKHTLKQQEQNVNDSIEGEVSASSKTNIQFHTNNTNNNRNRSISPSLSQTQIQFGSSKHLPTVPVKMAEREAAEKQAIVWLIYRLLDDESKTVILQSNLNALLPTEFSFFNETLLQLAQDNKLSAISMDDSNNNTTNNPNNNITNNANITNNNSFQIYNASSSNNICVSNRLIPI